MCCPVLNFLPDTNVLKYKNPPAEAEGLELSDNNVILFLFYQPVFTF